MSEDKKPFTQEDLENRLKEKMVGLPQPFALNEYVIVTEHYGAPRMVGKMGQVVKIEPQFDLYSRSMGNAIPDWVEIPEGDDYVEVPRWEITVQFSLGNTHKMGVDSLRSTVPEDANKGAQGVNREGVKHLVPPPQDVASVMRDSKSTGLRAYGGGDPSHGDVQGNDVETTERIDGGSTRSPGIQEPRQSGTGLR